MIKYVILLFCFSTFFCLSSSCQESKEIETYHFHFRNGYNKTPVSLSRMTGEVIFADTVTTDPVLGVAMSESIPKKDSILVVQVGDKMFTVSLAKPNYFLGFNLARNGDVYFFKTDKAFSYE